MYRLSCALIDRYLAALAIAKGWSLVSFDRDFERFEGLWSEWLCDEDDHENFSC